MSNEETVPQTRQAKEADTIFGRTVTVKFSDEGLAPETVTVRRVALRDMGNYSRVIGNDEAHEISLYTQKSRAWAETLDEDSVSEILNVGRELSKKRFARFAEGTNNLAKALLTESPTLASLAAQATAKAVEKSA